MPVLLILGYTIKQILNRRDLNDVKSSQSLNYWKGSFPKDSDISPDSSNYFLVLEELNTSNTQTEEWLEVDRVGGTVGGDFLNP